METYKTIQDILGLSHLTIVFRPRKSMIKYDNQLVYGLCHSFSYNRFIIEFCTSDDMLDTLLHELTHVYQRSNGRKVCCKEASRIAKDLAWYVIHELDKRGLSI